jgi:hypothetical protein
MTRSAISDDTLSSASRVRTVLRRSCSDSSLATWVIAAHAGQGTKCAQHLAVESFLAVGIAVHRLAPRVIVNR